MTPVSPTVSRRAHALPPFLLLLALTACQQPPPSESRQESPVLGTTRQGLRLPLDTVGDIFLGQGAPNFNSINLMDERGVDEPEGIALDTSVSPPRLYLADSDNNRILAWADATAFLNGAPADKVIGQPTPFQSTCNSNPTAATLCDPEGVEVDAAGNLYVADSANHRVLQYNTPFTSDGIADRVFGQGGNFSAKSCNAGGQPNASNLCSPIGVAVDSAGTLYVADRGNHRVLSFVSPLTDSVADGVIGQPGLAQNAPNRVDGRGLSNPSRVVIDRSVTPNRLYVADTDNHRVLAWNSATGFANGAPADKVLGQPDAVSSGCNTGGVSAGTLCYPRGLAVDALGNLYVADTNNHRVLLFNTPFTADALADKVWGQPNFSGSDCNTAGLGQGSLCDPWDVWVDKHDHLLVSDSGNNRVLSFEGARLGDVLADNVYGQPDFTTRTCNTVSRSATTLCGPRGVTVDASDNMLVADYDNSRVLVYAGASASHDPVADVVFGQPSMLVGSCNASGVNASTLCEPGTVAVDGAGNVWIGDEGNSRVLGYLSPISTNNVVADKVVGKVSLTSGSCATASASCIAGSSPAVAVDANSNLYVADPAANRVLAYNNPFSSDTVADRVLGQTDFVSTARNLLDGSGLNGPSGVHVDRTASPNRLYVVDGENHRVLAWSAVPVSNGPSADKVLGQAAFTTATCNAGGVGKGSLCTPVDVATDAAGNVYIADSNSRVLEYDNPYGTSGDTLADRVFGQPDFTGSTCNSGGVSALSLCTPQGVVVAPSGQVLVADTGNNRVLRYNAPLTSDQSADAVLGQGGFRLNGPNLVDGRGMDRPYALALDTSVTPNRLYVADHVNSRVLAWADVTTFQTGLSADLVLGQPDLLTSGCNSQGVSAASLCEPTGVAVDANGRVYVSDSENDRVLLYDSPFTTDTVADKVIGQVDYIRSSCNRGSSPAANTVCKPYGLAVSPAMDLFVSDQDNSRVLVFSNPWTTDTTADRVFGQQGSFTTDACNKGGRSASSLCYPFHLALDTSEASWRLYVVDTDNSRVLEYDAPLTSDTTADFVIGQTGMTTAACTSGQSNLCDPRSVAVDAAGNVYVSDSSNDRVLQYTTPRTTDAVADRLFGQSNYSNSACNSSSIGGLSASSLCGPRGLGLDVVGNLYVADTENHRIVIHLANNRPTASPLALTPLAPKTDDDLTGTYVYKDPDNDVQSGSEVRWFKNQQEQPAYFGTLTVPASATARGEQWYFTVRPRDGVEFGRPEKSPVVTIGNTPPGAATLAIQPSPPRTDDILTATYAFSDVDNDGESGSEIRWIRDNDEVPHLRNQRTVPASETLKGQVWSFSVRPRDGTDLGATVASPVVLIANTPPTASNVQISPASPSSNSSLSVSYDYADADGDTQLGSEIRWYRNGQLQADLNNEPTVPGARVQLNDTWYYKLRPRDGAALGMEVTSTTVEVGSSAPTVTNVQVTPNPPRTDNTLTASYLYSDPDDQPETNSQIRWFKNGVLTDSTSKTVPASATTKGDLWHFTITPCDNTPRCGVMQTSPTVTIGNTAPTASTPTVGPPSPKATDALTVSYGYADADADLESGSEIRWIRNGVEQASLANLRTLPAGTAGKNQTWYFTLRPKDGADFGEAVTSEPVTIGNTAPQVTQLEILPAAPRATDTLTASYTYSDVDGDSQSNSKVQWFLNGVEDPGLLNAVSVPPSKLARGQTWRFTVTPSDGTTPGTAASSQPVTIQNSPPVVANLAITPNLPNAGEALTATYAFSDADKDAQLDSELRWFKNGVEQTALFGLLTVPAGTTVKGERWSFSVRPKDGTSFGTPLTSAEVSIANSAPRANSLALKPPQPGTDDNLEAAYTYLDTDGDAESGTELRWFRNGVEAPAYFALKTLPASATTKGESWYVTVKPKDGTDFGQLVTSAPVVILNTPPKATNVSLSPLSPKATDPLLASYTYSDADGDPQQGTELRWYQNGVEVASLYGQFTVPAGTAKAGETWHFTVRPKDGVALGTLVTSTSVIVGSSAPVATVLQITPFTPSTHDTLVANYLYSDPDGEPESGSELEWYRNGEKVPSLSGSKTVPPRTARKGESWSFSVRPKDGTSFGARQTSPPVTLGNTPPSAASATIQPEQPRTDDVLQVAFTYGDADGDLQNGSEIRWYRNGLEQLALLNQTVVPASATTKREVWYYRVRPKDGTDHGTAEVSSPAFIGNSPPVANAGPDQHLVPTQRVMRVTLDGSGTRDADGDVLDYTWTEGSVELGRGVRVSVDLPVGTHTLTLSVRDGEDVTTDDVVIEIPDPQPTATAPMDFTSPPGRVVLTGSAVDPLGRTPGFQWTQVEGEPVVLQDADKASAWFLGTRAGTYTFELVATADITPSVPARTTVTVLNLPPWASAPARRVVEVGREVLLDGSGSDDPNADALTWRWTMELGASDFTLADAEQSVARFTPEVDGRYGLVLLVNDGVQASAAATTEVIAVDPQVKAHVPVAHAGPDGVGELDKPISLEGRGSYDVDGDALVYSWRKLSGPANPPVPANSPTPTFRATGAGTVVMGLTVSDGNSTSSEDTVTIEVDDPAVNHRPTARAGSDRTVVLGTEVQLDGTRSADPDGDVLTYQWVQLAGPQVLLDSDHSPRPTFTPTRPGFVRLGLTVTDGQVTSMPSSVLIQVTTGENHPPLASAGPDQQVIIGNTVTLDGAGTVDADGDVLRFVWEQVWGSPVMLEGSGAHPTFRPPGKGRYRFRLTAWDGEVPSAADEVDVVVSTHGADNKPPVAVAGSAVEVPVGQRVLLDGSGSHDLDPLDRLEFEWTPSGFPTGSEPVLAEANTVTPSFTPSVPGAYTLRLRVSDGDLTSAPSYVTVLAQPAQKSGPLGCGVGPGAPLPLAALLLVLLGRRTQRHERKPRHSRGLTATVLAALLLLGVAWTPGSAEAAPSRTQSRVKGKSQGKPQGKLRKKKKTRGSLQAPVEETPSAEEEAALPSEPTEEEATVMPDAPRVQPAPQVAGPGKTEGPPNPYLEEARQLYLSFQFEGLIPKLEFALAVKGVTVAQRMEIFKLMALTHSAFDDAEKAEESFLRILELQPDYVLTGGASPKIRGYFASAQKTYRARQAVKLRHAAPKPSERGETTTVDVTVTAGVDRVTAMTLHYRPRGTPSGYSQVAMARGEDGAFSGNVPNAFPGPAGKRTLEYFVRARDESGALLASVGTEEAPLELTMETVELTVSEPVYKSWVFWTAVGVGSVAAIITPVMLTRSAPVRPGTLGTEPLK